MAYDIVHTILDLVIFLFFKLSKKQSTMDEMEIHVHRWCFRTTTQLHSKGMIYSQTGYTRYIPGIYHIYTTHIPCKTHLLELRLHFQKA